MKTGILLLNLGTPDSPSLRDVGAYLSTFLMDRRVVDIPYLLRALLAFCLIVPTRSFVSAKAYRKIWTAQGSPLLINSVNIQHKLQDKLGEAYVINLAMRYGKPKIKAQLDNLLQHNCDNIIVIPLFPQYSSAATGSAIANVLQELQEYILIPNIKIVADFYRDKLFIQSWVETIKANLNGKKYDLILFSYHGLPERHLAEPAIKNNKRFCYREQCYATTALIAKDLGLHKNNYAVAFQSRLGRVQWIKPYMDLLLSDLIKQGVKNIAICCPSFVVDCLETLEEIGMRARESWQDLGGEEFHFVPCINDADLFVECLVGLIKT